MDQKQVLRVIKVLTELLSQGIGINSIDTKYEPDEDDSDFLNPVVAIEYHIEGQQQSHKIRVYDDGSMSDF